MIFMLDNLDSFTYNLVQYFQQLGEEVKVARNNEITVEEILALKPEAIILSPGPGRPENAGIMMELIAKAHEKIPLFGVCLGHQAIGAFYGMKVIHAQKIFHGKTSIIEHDGKGIFQGLSSPLKVVRYHSLVVDETTLPNELEISARSEEGEIMAMRHKYRPIESVQYHPESILTSSGKQTLFNFLQKIRG